MMASQEHELDEREYTLTEAARLLNKTEAALRMRIKRGTLRANVRFIDDSGDRYQYMIPDSALEQERQRGSSTIGAGPLDDFLRPRGESQSSSDTVAEPYASRNGSALAEVSKRLEQLEASLGKEREDSRALIRGLERQVELLSALVTQLVAKAK